jgi:hypothetical protein
MLSLHNIPWGHVLDPIVIELAVLTEGPLEVDEADSADLQELVVAPFENFYRSVAGRV